MIITKTPLRMSIGGGGTDLPFYYTKHGASLTTAAIDKYVYITVKQRFHQETRVSYSKTEIVKSNAEIEHPLVRECLKFLDITDPLEIVSISDVPAGSGMGSSCSFTVGLLNALHTYRGDYVSKKVLAEEACKIEMDILKEPIGKQDQYAAAYGGIIFMQINKQGGVNVDNLNISDHTVRELEHNLMFFYTNITRSASEVLSQQKKEAEADRTKMEYLTKIKEIGDEIKKALEKGNTRRFGEWMNIHWETKQTLSKAMTNDQINDWYAHALNNGAIGGKIMGAGGGGFFMFYCDTNHQRFRQAMADKGLVEMPFRFDFDGTKVIFNSR
jgi:D-glycero-alpha-D-manno-heptose-7-phosphate kinase